VACAVIALASLGGVAASATADVSGPDIVGFINAQRAAQGIPAGIVEDPALSDGCAKHNAYGAMNQVLTHTEDPAAPGYTAEGAQAAQTSVIYEGSGPWTATHDPFETAPIHLHQLLAPRIDRMGASENQDFGCATTLASRNRPAPAADVTYTYPGAGATAWPASQVAAEGPYTPGERVGIPAGTATGPYLYVMFDGADLMPFDTATATSATLAGPDGLVDVAVVDNHTPGLENYLPTGMEVIPKAPLKPGATYTASVAANVTTQGGGGPPRAFAHTWSFTTAELANAVRITRTTTSGRTIGVSVASTAPGATVTATGPGTPASAPVGGSGAATLTLSANGTWRVCAQSGGAATGYGAASDCTTVTVSLTSKPSGAKKPFTLSLPARLRHGTRTLRFTVRAPVRFTLRFGLATAAGHTIVRYRTHSLRGARTWTFRLRVSPPENRAGHSVELTLVIRVSGKAHTVRRRVRFS
jgi:hypothetical protein